jgi:putative transposase
MGLVTRDDGWRIPDELWAKMEPLLPPRPPHPLGCHNPRVPDRRAMDAILLVLRTGMQWQALKATGICHPSSAYRRFREWAAAGVFREFWRQGLLAYAALAGINWEWLAMDGAMGKAPLGGLWTGPNPTDRARRGTKKSLLTDGRGAPLGVAVAGANVVDFKRPAVGGGADPLLDSTGSAVCWYVGRSAMIPTWRCSTSPWVSSPGSTTCCPSRLRAT